MTDEYDVSPYARKRRFPKRVWLINHESQRGDSVEVCRSAEIAERYRTRAGWTVVEYVQSAGREK